MNQLLLGVNVSASAESNSDPVGQAQAAERLRFDFVSASDHPCGTSATYETWTMLTWICAATTRIKVATRVLGVPYRPPAMVAKMAETLDRLSGGRLILGLGGGYSDEEFRAFGLRVPSARDKVDGLDEAIRITHGLWSRPGFTFDGRLYRTADADLEPKPGHRIPIWLGTYGDRALRVTGRHADGWIPSLGHAPAEQLPAMRDKVMAAAQAAGRAPGDITCALNVEVHVGDGRAGNSGRSFRRQTGQPRSVAGTGHADPRPGLVAGSGREVADRIQGFAALGFTAFNFMPVGEPASEQMELIAAEVIPRLRTTS